MPGKARLVVCRGYVCTWGSVTEYAGLTGRLVGGCYMQGMGWWALLSNGGGGGVTDKEMFTNQESVRYSKVISLTTHGKLGQLKVQNVPNVGPNFNLDQHQHSRHLINSYTLKRASLSSNSIRSNRAVYCS